MPEYISQLTLWVYLKSNGQANCMLSDQLAYSATAQVERNANEAIGK